jgi:hypothetical protein
MGATPYSILNSKFQHFTFNKEEITLEIGTSWWDGHTVFINDWTKQHGGEFITIDVIDETILEQQYLWQCNSLSAVDFRTCTSGSDWCRDILPTLGKKIKVLYLDNFDWIWLSPDNTIHYNIQKQIEAYAKRGVVMNNVNCQQEHLLQVQYCLPYLSDECLIIMDDTICEINFPVTFGGKCFTALPVLRDAGFDVQPCGTPDSSNRYWGTYGYRKK